MHEDDTPLPSTNASDAGKVADTVAGGALGERNAGNAADAMDDDASDPHTAPSASPLDAGGTADTADTVAGEAPNKPKPGRSDSQARLHSAVRGRLFEGKAKPRQFEAGDTVAGRYRIISLLGVGGMGEVFRAHDLVLDQHVAIKFLPPEHADSEAFMKRFVNEVRLARKISHPSVCRVHDIGEEDGRSFLSMEYIDGEDLASLLRRIGRLPSEKAFELAQQLCTGLAALHDAGVLHRDLKPANLMIDGQGRLKIADFGLAAVVADLGRHELGDGTPAYMAPEQLRGEGVSESSDIYALGVVMYELLSGRHPHERAEISTGDLRAIDRSQPALRLARRVSGVPEEAIAVIEECLEDDPAARPQSVLDVAAALPGGDPIAAALLAGRAPSADTLANISKSVDAPPSQARWFSLIVLAAIIFAAFLADRRTLLGQVDSQLPPVLLQDRAKTMLVDAGIELPGPHELGRMFHDPAYARPARHAEPRFDSGPTPVLLEVRAAPDPFSRDDHSVGTNTPPMIIPGELRVWVDTRGYLRRFEQVPLASYGEVQAPAYTWDSLLSATGYDTAAREVVPPRRTPPFAADDLFAWDILREDGARVHVEAASWKGKPVWFEVTPAWASQDAAAPTSEGSIVRNIEKWLVLGLLVTLFVLVRRVYARGEADTSGAVRVALVIAASVTVGEVLAGPLGNSGSMNTFFSAVREGLLVGGFAFLGYVVVEPFGRRTLPRTMISWVRLTRGRWRDALVGRDILLGAAIGSILLITVRTRMLLLGEATIPLPSDLSVMHDLLAALGTAVHCVWRGAFGVMQVYLLFLVTLLVLRKPRLAVSVFFLLWTALELTGAASLDLQGFEWVVAILASLVVSGLLALTISRVGLLALTSAQIVANVIASFPFTTSLDNWYAPHALFGLATLAAMVALGSRAWAIADAQARRATASRTRTQTEALSSRGR